MFYEGDRVVTIEDKPGIIFQKIGRGTEVIFTVMLDEEKGGITEGPYLEEELQPLWNYPRKPETGRA